jgi:hypothetical protein
MIGVKGFALLAATGQIDVGSAIESGCLFVFKTSTNVTPTLGMCVSVIRNHECTYPACSRTTKTINLFNFKSVYSVHLVLAHKILG